MGLIGKQSIAGTIYSYIGVILGFVITAILYTRALTTEQVGLFRVIVSYATLFAMFGSLGFNAVTIKLFTHFRNPEKGHHGFLSLSLLVSLAGFLLSAAIYIALKTFILERGVEKSALFDQYFYYVVPLIFFTLFFNTFDTYYRVLYNAVKGIMVKEVAQRLAILIVILAYFYDFITFHETVLLYLIALIFPSVWLFGSLARHKQLFIRPDWKFITPDLRREMFNVGFFGILASFSGVLVLNIDILMINHLAGLSAAGIYTVTFYFGTLILIPLRTMGKISAVVIADAWKANDLETIASIYRKSSLSLSLIGFLLFIGIWGNIDNVFQMISEAYLPGKWVILFIGLANLTDVALGINPHIIVNSKHYRFLSYSLIFFAACLIIFNIVLIPIYGIVGAAIASLLSKVIFNGIKFLFLFRKFGLQPFNRKYLLLIVISLAAYGVSLLLPALSNYIVDIIVRSTLITIVFALPAYWLKISDDINDKVNLLLVQLKLRK
ncbi:MAG: oligosaccharide flippase family protein [bacterium]